MSNAGGEFMADNPDVIGESESQATLKCVQEKLLEGLREIDRVAAALGIPYLLIAGSALGAHRHRGFIPWDDDIDVAIEATNFRQFVEGARVLLGPDYQLQTRHEDPVLGATAKLYLSGTRIEGEFGAAHGLVSARNDALFVDIFPLGSVAENVLVRAWERAWGGVVYVRPWAWRMFRSPSHVGVGRRIRFAAIALFPKVIVSFMENRLWEKSEQRERSPLVGIGIGGINGHVYPRSVVLPPVPLEFEGVPTWGPRESQQFLSIAFGEDYMTLPPIERRAAHSLRVFIGRARGTQ